MANIPQDIRDIKRLEQILNVLFKYEMGYFIEKLKLKHFLSLHKRLQSNKFEKKETQPETMRKILEELGGTFIKLGQLLSLRPDLIPKEYCDEFKKLQDNVKHFPGNDALEIIKLEFNRDIKKVFSFFNKKPIAAASVAQVHEAVLKDGTKVVVKIQRPGIRKLIETDIDILYHLAHLIEKKFEPKIIKPLEIVKEFEDYTKNELNFVIEAKNIDKFYKNFENDKITKIPKVFLDYTTEKVLTMEFIDGIKISELKKIPKKRADERKIAKNIVNSVLKQVFVDGFFHADPHPGNIMVLKNNRIAFLDFGIVGHFDEELKEKIVNFFVSAVTGDLSSIAENFFDLGFVEPEINIEEFKEDLYDHLESYYGASLEEINISRLFSEMFFLAKKYNMHLPSDLILLGKTIVTVEGTAMEIYPGFNLVEEGKIFVEKLIKKRIHPKYIIKKVVKTTHSLKRFIEKFPNQTSELIRRIKEGDMGIHEIDKDIKTLTSEMDRSSNRIAIGLLITAFLISSALIMNVQQESFYGFPVYSSIGFLIALVLLFILFLSFVREKTR